ncbi:major facilitator superfamily domain-containing protein [Scheffersomyces coipomensis]|uniref:major facilitator superfamily domain-containing protein n=1 Tax=Scheffersomyces coipomensis TaxID=1788519 RepID=UPI00315D8F19
MPNSITSQGSTQVGVQTQTKAESFNVTVVSSRPPLATIQSSAEIRHMVNEEVGIIEVLPDQQSPLGKMSIYNPPKNFARLVVCVLWCFNVGFSDAAPGALLPHIEKYYGTNYAVTSCIWISNAMGFIVVAALSHKIQPWLGKRMSMTFGCFLSSIMYAIVSSGTVFPVVVIGFFFGGAGVAIVLSQSNVFIARLEKASKYLSFFHGFYGIGATISPLLGTLMVSHGVPWHYFYLILLGLMITSCASFFWTFEGADEDLKPWDIDESNNNNNDGNMAAIELEQIGSSETTDDPVRKSNDMSLMADALRNRVTWLIAFFCLFYQGSEVSIAGWIVSFLLDYRHGNPNTVGYAASGFWGGLTIGRLLLARPLHVHVGGRRSVIIVSLIAIILMALVWAIDNIFAEAVLVAIAGIFIGPNYTLLIAYTASERLLPRKIQVISLTIMTAFGSSGGALFPFLVGLLSEKVGTFVVLPVFIALYTSMVILWICLPNIENRSGNNKQTLWDKFW